MRRSLSRSKIRLNSFGSKPRSRSVHAPTIEVYPLFGSRCAMIQRWFEVTLPRRSVAQDGGPTERFSVLVFAESHPMPRGSGSSKDCGYSVIEPCSDRQSGF